MIPNQENRRPNYILSSQPANNENHRRTAVSTKEGLVARITSFVNSVKIGDAAQFTCIFPFNPEKSLLIKIYSCRDKNAQPTLKETCEFLVAQDNGDIPVQTRNENKSKSSGGLSDLYEFKHTGLEQMEEMTSEEMVQAAALFDLPVETVRGFPQRVSSNLFTKQELAEIHNLVKTKLETLNKNDVQSVWARAYKSVANKLKK